MRKIVLAAAGAALLILVPIAAASAQVQTVDVALCHATTVPWNPYQYTVVTIDSTGAAQTVGGHASHTGPIFDAHNPQPSWGDIIPPFTYGEFSYPGLNWDAKGQLVFKGHNKGHPNGCVDDLEYPPTPTPTPTPSTTSPTPSTTSPTASATKSQTDAPSVGPTGGGTAFTGGNFVGPIFAVVALAIFGLGTLLYARKRFGADEDAAGSPTDLY
jgi:hypothetical protein